MRTLVSLAFRNNFFPMVILTAGALAYTSDLSPTADFWYINVCTIPRARICFLFLSTIERRLHCEGKREKTRKERILVVNFTTRLREYRHTINEEFVDFESLLR